MSTDQPTGQQIQGKAACFTNALKNSFISAWVADSRDLKQKETLELESVIVQVNQVKEEVSLQNLSHRLAFSNILLY